MSVSSIMKTSQAIEKPIVDAAMKGAQALDYVAFSFARKTGRIGTESKGPRLLEDLERLGFDRVASVDGSHDNVT